MLTLEEIKKVEDFEENELYSSNRFIVDWFIIFNQKYQKEASIFLEKISRINEEYPGIFSFYLRKQCYFVEPNPEKVFDLLIKDFENNENKTLTVALTNEIEVRKRAFFKANPELIEGVIID